ncbi:hypothetical protein MIH18_16545 [Marinobacter sp. M3C]|jgi:L-fuconate dehydratase|uniref:enolase C-terminal domain-like protein n=1 Tax=Marinobacter sp. M3C TaxID=2917715 RepID=UPI0020108B3F|nr:enolase C-terminal domain-like protein [Marinobacter sp. M3C]UQG59323.1 hypothetical protein MIH18_16545 [Marinobacter sp. M3C]
MSPEELVRCLDFRFVTDALTPEEAIVLLREREPGKAEMRRDGFPGYITSAGWLGYTDDKVRQLARNALAEGWTHFKQKIGGDLEEDIRRAALLREEIGWENVLMMDAIQVWDVDETVAKMRHRVAPIEVVTGEHCHNKVMLKQFLWAEAIDYCQIDAAVTRSPRRRATASPCTTPH